MKRTTAMMAAVAFVAMTGIFAQTGKAKKSPDPKAPEQKEPPKIERPSDADIKAYHDAEKRSLEILLEAQVKAKIISQEWADVQMALLKAAQADCKGDCIVFGRTDIPFGAPARKGHDCMGRGCEPGLRSCDGPRGERHEGPRFDRTDFDGRRNRPEADGQEPRAKRLRRPFDEAQEADAKPSAE